MLLRRHKLLPQYCGAIPPRARGCQFPCQFQPPLIFRRSYATPIDSEHVWPTNTDPTPYQIFNCAKGDTYSKQRYYELCKLYHPDRFCKGVGDHEYHLSDKVRNDRFRLVVAANEILSDPMKRRAYDRYGIGWSYPGAGGIRYGHGAGREHIYRHATGETQHPWWTKEGWSQREGHDGPPDPYNYATWEDWEKYHAYRDGAAHAQYTQPQQPVFTSNATFLSILFCFVSVGSVLSINHAQKNGQTYIADREKVHEQIWKDVERRRKEAKELGDKDERVRNFLRQRDPAGWRNGEELAGGKYQRLLPEEQQGHEVVASVSAPPKLLGPPPGNHHDGLKGKGNGGGEVGKEGQLRSGPVEL